MTVGDNRRHKRLRCLLKGLNKNRKRQAKQIDILCNDFIEAQRDFIRKLKIISFTASFHESIIGTFDLNTLLYTAAKQIRNENADINVIFFLREEDDFKVYAFGNNQLPAIDNGKQLAECFNHEVMDNICKSNKVCSLEEMYQMGLQGNPGGVNETSVAAIPLGLFGSPLGFMFVYCSPQSSLTADDTGAVVAVTSGLSRAIASCSTISHTAD